MRKNATLKMVAMPYKDLPSWQEGMNLFFILHFRVVV